MIHGRNITQKHSGPVNFKIIKEVRKYFSGIILTNGGVRDKDSAIMMLKSTNADGLGIG